jgi:dihydrofolate reductase
VNSALQRARKAVDERVPHPSQQAELDALGPDGRRELVDAFVAAWERADVAALLELLTDDARFTMPPLPAWFSGRVVVSDTLTADDTDPWRSTTRIVGRADAHDQVAELKRRPGREILTFGSRTLWNDLLAHDLVDELHLMLGAAVIGAGTPIFGAKPPGRLRLAEARRFDGSDNLVVRYRPGPDAG